MLTNWITNSKMKKLLEYSSNYQSTEEINLNMQQLKQLFSPLLKKVKDCIIITEKEIDKLEIAFDNMIKMYGDKTGYEASNTETRINCYFENEISTVAGTQIALMVIEIWGLRLKQMEPNSQFCLIMCSDEEHVEIRFHKVREDEDRWLSDNLEVYSDEAVGYVIV